MLACFHSIMLHFAGGCLYGLTLVLAYIMVSWSLIPGIGSILFTSEGRFVRNRSRVFSFLVGKSTSCVILRYWKVFKKTSLVDFVLMLWPLL